VLCHLPFTIVTLRQDCKQCFARPDSLPVLRICLMAFVCSATACVCANCKALVVLLAHTLLTASTLLQISFSSSYSPALLIPTTPCACSSPLCVRQTWNRRYSCCHLRTLCAYWAICRPGLSRYAHSAFSLLPNACEDFASVVKVEGMYRVTL